MIRLNVLGGIRVSSDGVAGAPHVLMGDRRLGLLVYLALAGPAYRRRESLVALFWPDQKSDQARHSLRQLLHMLRESVGEAVVVTSGDEYVGVEATRLWCDALEFRQAVNAGVCERALELYEGPFCDGFSLSGAPEFDRWLEKTRAEFHERAAECARVLARRYAASGDPEAAIRLGRRALRLVPEDEGVLRWLLQLTAREEGLGAAQRLYEEHVRALMLEFELRPSPETIALMRSLRVQYA